MKNSPDNHQPEYPTPGQIANGGGLVALGLYTYLVSVSKDSKVEVRLSSLARQFGLYSRAIANAVEALSVMSALRITSRRGTLLRLTLHAPSVSAPADPERILNISEEATAKFVEEYGRGWCKAMFAQMKDYAKVNPAKWRKYKDHEAVFRQWTRSAKAKGYVFVHDHPEGAGLYLSHTLKQQQRNFPLAKDHGAVPHRVSSVGASPPPGFPVANLVNGVVNARKLPGGSF